MTRHIQTILKEVQFEDADRASFSESHFDVTIGNRPKKGHGKGYRAFFNTVVNLAVRAYVATNTDLHAPVVVIDTPTLGLEYGKSGNSLITKRDKSNRPVHGLLRNLFDYMADSANLGQIIILNNTDVTPVVHYNDELNGEVIFGETGQGNTRTGLLHLQI